MGSRARRNAVRAADWIITYILAAVFTIVIVMPLPGQAEGDGALDRMNGGVPRNILDTIQLFTKVAQCTSEGWACVRINSSRRQVRQEGRSWLPLSGVKGLEPKDQPFPTVPRVTTDAPGRKALPPAHLSAQVRAMSSIRECFNDQGALAGIDEAVRREGEQERIAAEDGRPTRLKPVEIRLQNDIYTPLALEVFRLGHSIIVNEHGKVDIATEKKTGTKMNVELFTGKAIIAGVRDFDALDQLLYGVKDNTPSTPMNSIYSSNQASAVEHAVGFQKTLSGEMDKGYFHPASPAKDFLAVPLRKSAWGGVVKANGSIRNIADESLKGLKHAEDEYFTDEDGNVRFYASNRNHDADTLLEFSWLSVSDVCCAISILLFVVSIAPLAGGLLGQCYDLKGWFRQMEVSRCDWYKQCGAWKGEYYMDMRSQMGRVCSAHICQRISFMIAIILLYAIEEAYMEKYGWITNEEPWASLNQWRQERLDMFDGDIRQAQLWFIHPFQDDFPVFTLAILVTLVDETIKKTLKALEIDLSGKETGFSDEFNGIGAKYNVGLDPTRRGVQPRDEFIEGFAEAIVAMVALQGVTGIPEAQSIAGKNEWASRFHDKGARLCVSTYQVLARAGHQRSKHALFKEKAIQDLQETCERITMKRAFVADPVFNFAEDQISADASTSFGCGIQVGPILVAISWKDGTFDAIERSRKRLPGESVSISPLELLVQGWLIEILCTFLTTQPGEQILGRTDSESSESVINSGRVSSPPMAEAMYVVVRNQDKFNVVYRAKHIATFKNTVPDMLSKNKIEEAMALTRERWGKAYLFEVPTEMRQRWLEDEDRVVKAASH